MVGLVSDLLFDEPAACVKGVSVIAEHDKEEHSNGHSSFQMSPDSSGFGLGQILFIVLDFCPFLAECLYNSDCIQGLLCVSCTLSVGLQVFPESTLNSFADNTHHDHQEGEGAKKNKRHHPALKEGEEQAGEAHAHAE